MKDRNLLFSVLVLWAFALFQMWQGNTFSAGFCFVIAVCDTMLWFNGQWPARKQAQNRNYQILQRTFGPFTWLAAYGTLGILASLVLLYRIYTTPWTGRIMLAGVGLYLLWGLYLCFLVFAGKNSAQEKTLNRTHHQERPRRGAPPAITIAVALIKWPRMLAKG